MLHPIRALDHVIDSYRDYLTTEFSPRDTHLRKALEEALEQEGFLAQEPYFSAHRPFPQDEKWSQLPLDSKLAEALKGRSKSAYAFRHQSQAIRHLLGSETSPLVVTTGTGSGKTETFLVPVLQAAIDDAVKNKKKPGLVSLILYPMNALANDQLERIDDYLGRSGWKGAIDVRQYNRTTSEKEREAMRKAPPHILLTNYQMLEYLLVRPNDREALFKDHRMRFLVMDEVHTYRGTLGTHVALLIRRLKAHLRQAVPGSLSPISIGTSATIKSHDPDVSSASTVQGFFGKLVGESPERILVINEERVPVSVPPEARYSGAPYACLPDIDHPDALLKALGALSDGSGKESFEDAAKHAKILWDLNEWLSAGPRSLSDLIKLVRSVPERAKWDEGTIRKEVVAALRIGAALPEGTPGALRLRAHRFVRGGWAFHRCLNPDCGKLFPKGEEKCDRCGSSTAPLYVCRSCGADFWYMTGPADGVGELKPLLGVNPYTQDGKPNEWLLYQPQNWKDEVFEEEDEGSSIGDDEGEYGTGEKRQRSGKTLTLSGSFDPASLTFDPNEQAYPHQASLHNSRRKCPGCGMTGGPRPIITRVSLGTSAAVKVLSEGLIEALPIDPANTDHKKRLLAFADSRQDAAHQARFVHISARYDRMRQRVVKILQNEKGSMPYQRVVEELGQLGWQARDNPYLPKTGRPRGEDKEKVLAYEEAPMLDDIAVNTRYRAALENLGLISVSYLGLEDLVANSGQEFAQELGITLDQLNYLMVQLLDTLRRSGVLHRDLLRYHPENLSMSTVTRSAEWERRLRNPTGIPCGPDGYPMFSLDETVDFPAGVSPKAIWGKSHVPTAPQKVIIQLLDRMTGGHPIGPNSIKKLFIWLTDEGYLKLDSLHGYRGKPVDCFQVNDAIIELSLASETNRARCDTCTRVVPSGPVGMPCPRCQKGTLRRFMDQEVRRSRYAVRALNPETEPLVSAEHTAQVTAERRKIIEDQFKSAEEPINFLACSPTLELGIDVGQMDAVVLRNVPPRPDNYAQRGGRAGRRSRVGLIVGYTRATPHDQYFFDHPGEMIAGEVPAPAFGLGNRDALLRHINAIACGLAEPGLSSKMNDYVDFQGEVQQTAVDELLEGIKGSIPLAVDIAKAAFGQDALKEAGFKENDVLAALLKLPDRIQDAINRTAKQVKQLRATIELYAMTGQQQSAANRATSMINRLLGVPDGQKFGEESNDIGSAYPLRRFAEAGLLPGYEFPVEPATLRLLGDEDEWSTISTARPAGLRQYQPGAPVYARGKRWKVFGVDLSSPWNPQDKNAAWQYITCSKCKLAYDGQLPSCPRCADASPGKAMPAYAYAGFMAKVDETIVSDEEDRVSNRDLVQIHPSWQADQVAGRWAISDGWRLEWRRGELVRWLNEGPQQDPQKPSQRFMICPQCGKLLSPPPEKPSDSKKQGKAPARGNREDPFGHAASCSQKGQPGQVGALFTEAKVETLRILFPWAGSPQDDQALQIWGITLGEALLVGAQHYFALSPEDLMVLWEGTYESQKDGKSSTYGAITFIDPNIGGSGYLPKLATELNKVAQVTLHHLDHDDCETACYRCLKSYQNQRNHYLLRWPVVTSTLQGLAETLPQELPLTNMDMNDPKPWQEAFAAGCGSPLEYRFLKILEDAGLAPTKQYPISDGSGKAFTVADFAFPKQRLAIYVDGLSFHKGDRLRRDQAIEIRLNNLKPSWKFLRFTSKDFIKGNEAIIKNVQGMLTK